ncbi:MAG: hypothetical protein MJK04_19075, partial [Psychrosphaera sp.]|nr:hypothetical protein [Psychrosphaera sp.]
MNIKSLILGLTTVAAMAGATTLYAATQDTVEVKVEAEQKELTVTTDKAAEKPKEVTTDGITDKSADVSAEKNTDESVKEAAD